MCNYFLQDELDDNGEKLENSYLTNTSDEVASKKTKKRRVESEFTQIMSGAAESIGQLVSVVSSRKSENSAAHSIQPDDDDWWFCKRMYHKLKNFPDGHAKEYFKLNMDFEMLRMTYGSHSSRECDMSSSHTYVTGDVRSGSTSGHHPYTAMLHDETNMYGDSTRNYMDL